LSVDETASKDKTLLQQAFLKSLEVLEERSNEDYSPCMVRKKRTGRLVNLLSSSDPTNFINTPVSHMASSDKQMATLQTINLTNQRDS